MGGEAKDVKDAAGPLSVLAAVARDPARRVADVVETAKLAAFPGASKEPPRMHVFWILAVLMLVLTWSAVYFKIRSELTQTLEAANRNNLNLARAVEEHTVRTLKSVDQAVLFLKFQYERFGTAVRIGDYVREGMIISNIFNQLGVINEQGIYELSSLPNHRRVDLSDREHFRVHIAQDTNQLFISKPVVGRASGKASIQLSRRINKADGSFGGAVVISVDPYYFTSFYSDVDLGAQGVVSLVGEDGIIRARRSGENSEVGQSIAGTSFQQFVSRHEQGHFEARSPIDGVERLYAYRHLQEYPLAVFVGIDREEALADYRVRVKAYLAFGSLVTVLVMAFLFTVTWYLRRQYEVGLELQRSQVRAEEANRLKSEFLASVSHELRTPLNGIIGYAEFLRDGVDDPLQKEFAGTILDSGQHLLGLVNSILDLAKIEAGKMELVVHGEPLREMVEQVFVTHQPVARKKGLGFELLFQEGLPVGIECDRVRVTQVLNNLLHNAIKFTDCGTVTLSVLPQGEDMVWFSVRDTGCGIGPEDQARIFDRFHQGERFVTRRHGGTGLGLALVQELVALMGGQLELRSVLGEGSEFRFSLPQRALHTSG